MKSTERQRERERESLRERYCVFWLELVCFVCWESKWRVVREKGVRVGERKSFSSDGQEKVKAGVDEIRWSQSRWRVMVCSWSPLDTLFVCFFFFLLMLQKWHVKAWCILRVRWRVPVWVHVHSDDWIGLWTWMITWLEKVNYYTSTYY